MQFQLKSWHFAKAFFNGDLEYIKKISMDLNKLDDYGFKNQFNEIQALFFRFYEYNDKTKTAYGKYIFLIDEYDSLKYLSRPHCSLSRILGLLYFFFQAVFKFFRTAHTHSHYSVNRNDNPSKCF